jgi:lipopolysaccharide transport system permease protein
MVDFASGLVIVLAMAFWFGITPTVALVAVPFFLLLAVLTALALALWLAPLNARYRDVGHTVPFIVQAWMFASPVVYPASIVPEQWRVLYGLNPMAGVIEGFRWALLGNTAPQFGLMAMSAAVVAVLTIGGIAWFKRMELTFADVL